LHRAWLWLLSFIVSHLFYCLLKTQSFSNLFKLKQFLYTTFSS
jgi:hypothetical protein